MNKGSTRIYCSRPILDASTKAFISATGLTGTTETTAVNNLVIDLKKYGLWSKMKAIYPFVSDTVNLLSYTEDLSNGVYSNAGLTLALNSTTAPDGTNTADKLTPTTTNAAHDIKQTTSDSSTTVSYSCYLKYNGYSYVNLNINDNVANGAGVLFDINNGTIVGDILIGSGWSVNSKSITSVGNGWYRCVITITATGSTRKCEIGPRNTNSTTWSYLFAGDGTSGVYAWGLQCQSGASTTYQPIATTPANRFVSQFKYNLKDPVDMDASFRLAFNGGWTYSKQGATPNGTNAFANTYLTPSVNLDSTFSLSYYSNLNIAATSANTCEIGAFQSGSQMIGLSLRRNLNADLFGTDGYGQSATTTSTNSNFYGIASRNSTTSLKLWKNNTLVATNITTDTGARPTLQITLAVNNGLTGYSNRRCAFSHIGNGLSDLEVNVLSTIVQRFQVSLNRYAV